MRDPDTIHRVADERSKGPISRCRLVTTSVGKAAALADGSTDSATHELCFSALFLRLRAEVEGWRMTLSMFDARLTAALDSDGIRYEVICRPTAISVAQVVANCTSGLQVW